MDKGKKIPAFFKPFVVEDREQRLSIPLTFSAHMEEKLPRSASLKDRNGKRWHVEVARRGHQFYFEGGWPNFVQENGVEFGDFLVFWFDGRECFDFKIFGSTACEKELNVGNSGLRVEKEEKEEEEQEVEEIAVDDEDHDEEEEESVEEDHGDFMEEEEEEVGDDDDDNDDEVVFVEAKNAGKSGRRKAGKSRLRGWSYEEKIEEEEEIFASGLVNRPKNPYFLTRENTRQQTYLYIPTNLLRDFQIKLRGAIDIHDDQGRRWPTKVNEWIDGRTCLSWKAFREQNKVKREDKCLCEFIPANGEVDIFLRIQILRAGTW